MSKPYPIRKPLATGIPMNKPGIYCIRNVLNQKSYIGSASKCIRQRCNGHIGGLRNGTHHSRHLQSAWDKYGEDSFEFYVIEFCKPEKCLEREQVWLDTLLSYKGQFGYNINNKSTSCLGVKRTEATKAKLSEIAQNRSPELKAKILAATTTPEALAKIGAAHKGKTLSEDTREKIRAKLLVTKLSEERKKLARETILNRSDELKEYVKERQRSPESRAKISAARKASKGKRHHSEATKAKIAAAHKGKKRTAEHAANLSRSLKGRKASNVTRLKMSISRKGRKHSAEHTANQQASAARTRNAKLALA